MRQALRHLIKDESGATAIEYALIAALIAVALIASLDGVQAALANIFARIAAALNAA